MRVEDEQAVAGRVDDVGEPALAGRHVRRPGAGGRAADPLERRAVVQLEHPLADGDDGDRAAAVDRRHAAGLPRHADAPHVPALDDRQRAAALVGGEDPPAGGGRVVREGADRHGAGLPAGQRHAGQRVAGLGRDEHRPARPGEPEVPRRARQRHAPPHLAARAVHERQLVRLAQADGDEPGGGIGDDPLGPVADRHDTPGGAPLERRGTVRLGRRREVADGRRAAAGERHEGGADRGAAPGEVSRSWNDAAEHGKGRVTIP